MIDKQHELEEAGLALRDEDGHVEQFGYVIPSGDESYAGMVAHRGVLSDREFLLLDWDVVEQLVVARLGVTMDELAACYPEKGTVTNEMRPTRDHVDSRFLAIQEAGGNILQLATVLGWPISKEDGRCWKIERAVARAKKARETS